MVRDYKTQNAELLQLHQKHEYDRKMYLAGRVKEFKAQKSGMLSERVIN